MTDNPNPIIRIMPRLKETIYVAGYYGFVESDIDTPVGTRSSLVPEEFLDPAHITWDKYKEPVTVMIYLGLGSASRDITCYLRREGKNLTNIVGRYKGDGVVPDRLDDKYWSFGDSFDDKGKLTIWQFNLKGNPFSAADVRLAPIAEGAALAGEMFFRQNALPKMVLGAIVRGADGTFASTVRGWVKDQKGVRVCVPDEHTAIPIASITKAFTGQLLARLVAQRAVHFTDQTSEDPAIRLIDLATHTSGLPRGVEPDIDLDPAKPALLPSVLFPPGTGASYSNVGFNLLGREIYKKCGRPGEDKSLYDLLKREVLSPLHLDNTSFEGPSLKLAPIEPATKPPNPPDDLDQNLFGGHDFDGKVWTMTAHDKTPRGSSGLYSTPGDILKWLEWHLRDDRHSAPIDGADAEARLLDHAAYVQRDGLHPVIGMDESGHMDAMSLGWVVMTPKGDRPLILHKSGGTRGVFSFVAFSPSRGVGFFIAIDQFNVAAGVAMAEMVADLIMTAAPR